MHIAKDLILGWGRLVHGKFGHSVRTNDAQITLPFASALQHLHDFLEAHSTDRHLVDGNQDIRWEDPGHY